jgi:hypothetical protein
MYMVVNQFLYADIKTWVKTLHIDSWVRLQKEMIEYYVDPLEENPAWNSLNKLQQTGPVKDYSEKFLQLIVKVGNNVTEKDKLRRYGASSSGAANHHKTGRYPVPVNTMRNANKLSKEDT